MNKKSCLFVLFFAVVFSLGAQTHLSVPLGDPVYYVLEQAQMRGLIAPLPGAKPYSRAKILSAVEGILAGSTGSKSGNLTAAERRVLEQFRKGLSPERNGFDLMRGTYSFESPQDGVYFSGEFGFGADASLSGAYRTNEGDFHKGGSSRIYISFKGDLGTKVSFATEMGLGFFYAPRGVMGKYDSYYPDYIHPAHPDTSFINRELTAYSEPLAYFPYSYKKNWDGHLFYPGGLTSSGQEPWPQKLAVGYFYRAELAGTWLGDRVSYRVARIDREWGAQASNASLVLNGTAQPFMAMELTAAPFAWLTFSSITGVLEYVAEIDPKASAEIFQNAFSASMLELNYKDYFHFDFGTSALWPKRFEPGYIFPLIDNFTYQNSIGDFDNMAVFFSLKGQYPGLGKLWFSFFGDEFQLAFQNWFKLDRNMFAFQFGGAVQVPWLNFSSVTLSYTKIEPYNYTHTREFVPWYGKLPMETNYVNSAVCLGSYLPPNSDEILVRFETVPALGSIAGLQYQMIRHGAAHGGSAVDGSSLWSELDPRGRNSNTILRKNFLKDGAYQWSHIAKIRGEYSFVSSNIPVRLFAEAGGVYSYYTNIEGEANSGSPSSYSVVDTAEYPHSFNIIGSIGIKLFPK